MTNFDEIPITPPRRWKVVLTVLDSPHGRKETYLTKEEVISNVRKMDLCAGLEAQVLSAELVPLRSYPGETKKV